MRFEPVVLEGKYVRLEPLSSAHRQGLCEAISDGELWNLHVTLVPHPSEVDAFLNNAREAYEAGDGLAFATIDRVANKVAGSTCFMKANLPNRRVEIGFTFLGGSWQRTSFNTEAKLLMLTHAFETLGMNRVEFLTDYLNERSRRAILRLGAKEEGILRNHMVMPNGRVRDSVLYSIISNEWPGVKQHLSFKLSSREAQVLAGDAFKATRA
jgi:RimJ/RimL family protein N-acetyltransferase